MLLKMNIVSFFPKRAFELASYKVGTARCNTVPAAKMKDVTDKESRLQNGTQFNFRRLNRKLKAARFFKLP